MAEPSCLINCTIPVKLRDFLKENGINRSQLFREAALKMYEHEICPKCYGYDIIDSYKGKICRDCNKWLVQKACPTCDVLYTPNLHGTPYKDKIVCNECFKIAEKEVNDWYNEELSKVNKDE
tara:strand:+ start:1594 stop:1959 length:366 start_codon:yes stop_codon:yes gene_type:complete